MPESAQDAFNRGYESGRVNTRLDGHDVQLASMTNTLAKVVDIEEKLTLTVQRLGLNAEAQEEKAVALAVALKDQAEERRAKDSDTWSKRDKVTAALIAAAILVVAIFGVWIQWRIVNAP